MRRYKISKIKNAGFGDKIKSFFGISTEQESKLIRELKSQHINIKELKLFEWAGQKFAKINGETFFYGEETAFKTLCETQLNNFINKWIESLDIQNSNKVTHPNMTNFVNNFVNNAYKVSVGRSSLIQIS